ncbi:MAG: substrate-binding domain-containing protein [Gemmatimonadetes bacterium]|nr:substrate-binding domain-containing protein [Gemmatimonadota bacterium]
MCRDDYVAIDVCRGLQELGLRVPEDVAVEPTRPP